MSTDARRLADPVLASTEVAIDRPRQHRPDADTAGASGPVPAWFRFFSSELRLVFGRPRNLALLGVLALVPIFFGIVFRLTLSAPTGPGNGPAFLNQLAGNGVFLALVVLSLTLLLLLPLAIAVIAGDSVAGEAGLGTLRGLLTVPAGRSRLLAVKYAVIGVFSLAACLEISALSLIMGLVLFHTGPVTLLSGTTISLGAGVVRILLVTVYVALGLTSLGAIGLAASTLTQHPVGAIAGLLVIAIASEICDQVPQLSSIHSFLPTHYWLSWDGLFRAPIDWSGMTHGLVSFAVYAVVFGSVAWAKFTSADVTS
ncbi:MAG TPA: ABC transporter permease [Streptosporangiaceae bacterium]|jgi:ABC-2 type transport system permease protein|nr:ABC transporter permease [Streptosporangiaceae bacterium]